MCSEAPTQPAVPLTAHGNHRLHAAMMQHEVDLFYTRYRAAGAPGSAQRRQLHVAALVQHRDTNVARVAFEAQIYARGADAQVRDPELTEKLWQQGRADRKSVV